MNGYSKRERDEVLDVVRDPFARSSLRAAYHVRRFLALYVVGALALIALAILPTVSSNGTTNVSSGSTGGSPYGSAGGSAGGARGASGGLTSSAATLAGGAATSGAGLSGASAGGSSATGSGGVGAGPAGSSGGAANLSEASTGPPSPGTAAASSGGQVGTGVTVGGVRCAPGVRQVPFSAYSDPCVSKWSGNNGGATWNGVTANTITVAIRHTSDASGANSLEVQAEVEASGGQPYNVDEGYTDKLVALWNKTMELYGRQVKLVDYNGVGNYTDEELDQDQTGACADADTAATSVHAFGVIDYEGVFETGPFAQCAARYHLYIPEGAAYFPESFYDSINPYVWAAAPNCTQVAAEVVDFAGNQLVGHPTKWAGDDGAIPLNGKPRKTAIYVPNNAGYQSCTTAAKQELEQKYHVSPKSFDQYNYALDISTFPQDAQKAIIQFAADQDTTVELACDPISPIFLTQDAVNQHYFPEWLDIGVAFTDEDSWAQLWDQAAIDGHLFGLSESAQEAALLSPSGEAGRFLTAAGVPINESSALDYYLLMPLFNQLQAAGPDLTPANIGAATPHLPPGGSDFTAEGPWYFGSYHTLDRGSREIYWEGTQTSAADNKPGTFVALDGGRYFQPGEFPSGEPAYYP